MTRLVMALLCIFVNLPCFSQTKAIDSSVRRFDLEEDDISLEAIVNNIFPELRPGGNVHDSTIYYGHPHFCIHRRQISLDSFFRLYLDPLRIQVIDDGTTLILQRPATAKVYEWRVLDNQRHGLANASVTLRQGKETTWMTDDGGRLFFAMEPGPFTGRITHVGYQPVEITHPDRVMTIGLENAFNDLDAPTITGYTVVSARDNTSSPGNVRLPPSEKESNDNIQEALKARVAGVSITAANGVPGASEDIRIRGRGSIINANSPLVIVDGIPVYLGNPGAANIGAPVHGAAAYSPLSIFSSNMIGTVSVLKDAASTAIYGSRGANGVLLFNTLVDTVGTEKWSLNLGAGATRIVPIQSPLSTRDYLALRKAAIRNDGFAVDSNSLPEAYLWDSTRNTNFKRRLIGNPGSQLDLSGRFLKKDTAGYLVINGWLHRETTVFSGQPVDNRGSVAVHFGRHPIRHHYAWQGSVFYTVDDLHLPANDLTNYIRLAPNTPSPYNSNGQLAFQSNDLSYLNYEAIKQNTYANSNSTLFAHGQWTDTVWQHVVLKLSGGFNSTRIRETVVVPAFASDPMGNPNPIVDRNTTHYNTLVAEPMIEYRRKIRDSDQLQILAGFNWQQQVTGLSFEETIDAGGSPANPVTVLTTLTGNRLVYRYEAVFARLHYFLDNRYVLDLSFRRDGSSRFGPQQQFGNFGAVGAGWIFSHTRLLRNSKPLRFGKLRASYGTVGSDQIGDYQYMSLWNSQANGQGYRGAVTLQPVTADNPDLRWEVQHQVEAGVDMGWLKNKIFLTASYYYRWSGNELVYSSLSGQSGLPKVLTNIPARVVNKGLEIEVTAHLLTTPKWQWTVFATLTVPENKLVAFPGLATSLYANQLTIGKPLSEMVGYRSMGVDPQTGLFTFQTNQTGKVITNIGNTEMQYYGGFSSTLTYKAITLDLFWEYRRQKGLSALPQLYQNIAPGQSDPNSALSNPPINPDWYWKNPGDHSLLQKPTATPGTAAAATLDTYINSSAKITDASFGRLRSVTIECRIDPRLLGKWGCQEGKIYIEAKNILTLTHYLVSDPEVQSISSLPPLRTIRCGLRLKF